MSLPEHGSEEGSRDAARLEIKTPESACC